MNRAGKEAIEELLNPTASVVAPFADFAVELGCLPHDVVVNVSCDARKEVVNRDAENELIGQHGADVGKNAAKLVT